MGPEFDNLLIGKLDQGRFEFGHGNALGFGQMLAKGHLLCCFGDGGMLGVETPRPNHALSLVGAGVGQGGEKHLADRERADGFTAVPVSEVEAVELGQFKFVKATEVEMVYLTFGEFASGRGVVAAVVKVKRGDAGLVVAGEHQGGGDEAADTPSVEDEQVGTGHNSVIGHVGIRG